MVDIYSELLEIVRNYCDGHSINCRATRNQIHILYTGTRNGYDTVIAYYKNKAHGLMLYIDYDVMRGVDNVVLRY